MNRFLEKSLGPANSLAPTSRLHRLLLQSGPRYLTWSRGGSARVNPRRWLPLAKGGPFCRLQLSTVVGFALMAALLCLTPAFPVPAYAAADPAELPGPAREQHAAPASVLAEPSLGGGQFHQIEVDAYFTPPAGTVPSYLVIKATIRPGHYIYSVTQPPGGPRATRIRLEPSDLVRLAGDFQADPPPKTKHDPLFNNLRVEYHEDQVTWWAPLQWQGEADPKASVIRGSVQVQVCDATTCFPPREFPFEAKLRTDAPLPAAQSAPTLPAAEAAPPAISTLPLSLSMWFTILAGALLGGLVLNLMPCVLPVISLKLFALIEQAGQDRRQIFLLNLWFTFGLLSVFIILATFAAAFNLAWGEQFTYTWFKVALIGLVFVLALSFLGVWELPIPGFAATGSAGQLQTREGATGAFFKGVFTTILATPCTGPFLGAVFGFTLDKPPYVAYLIFGTVGLGMALPYLVIGAAPQLLRFLPKPGPWMQTLKEVMGFLLLGTVVYLFSTIQEKYFIPALTFVVGLWFACWLVGKIPLTASRWQRWLGWTSAFLLAAATGAFAFTVLLPHPKIPWEPFSPERLEAARREGRTVMVDFTADWCPNCKWNLATAIETARVAALIQEYNILPLLADWTDESPVIKNFLEQRLRRRSIPVLAIWPAGAGEGQPIILDGILLENQVLEALRQAGPSKLSRQAPSTAAASEAPPAAG
jgi:thiol:disulfide interchange protein